MMHHPTYIAYIDESGDEGFRFGEGSSQFFVIATAIVRRSEEAQEVKLIDEVRQKINSLRAPDRRIPDKKPLHFRDLGHEQRRFLAQRIARAEFKAIVVMIDKTQLDRSEFLEPAGLYHWAMQLLVERISWCCNDHASETNEQGVVRLVLSDRAGMNYRALQQHLHNMERSRERNDYQIIPNIVSLDQIETFSPGRRMGLQIADAIASSCFFAAELNKYGSVEEAYFRDLLPCFYRRQQTILGYGCCIQPQKAEER